MRARTRTFRKRCALWSAALLVSCYGAAPAYADYQRAYAAYQAGNFDAARREFLELAGLGDHASQMILSVMSRRGEAGPVDAGAAVGWASAAVENGSTIVGADAIARARAKLDDAGRAAADAIIARYGRAALERSVLPPDDGGKCDAQLAKTSYVAPAGFPTDAVDGYREGVVLLDLVVGIDGLPKDVRVVHAMPRTFARNVVRAVYQSRFVPAVRDGEPAESRMRFKWIFTAVNGSALWDAKLFADLRRASDQGVPVAQYFVGSVAFLDDRVGIDRKRARNLVMEAAKGGHAAAQTEIARWLLVGAGCSHTAKARIWLDAAARNGDPSAAAMLVDLAIEETPEALPVDSVRAWLRAAAESEDEYALKHAIPFLAGLGPTELADPPLALAAAERLDRHGLRLDPQALESRAAALAANGQFGPATKLQKSAVESARDLSWNTAAMEERLAAYRENRVWRGDLYLRPVQEKLAPPRYPTGVRLSPPAAKSR